MTGGQPFDGPLTPAAHRAPGRRRRRRQDRRRLRRARTSIRPATSPAASTIHDRDELDAVQRKLRDTPGCTVLLYDQTCAAEKRRRRKRGKFPGSGEARGHQRARLRGLRRLRRQVELRVGRAGRDRVRPQAHDRPELVQQGFLVREGLLPELRHRRGRHAAQAEEGRGRRVSRPARSRAAGDRRALRHPGHRHRRHRRRHDRRADRHGGAPRRQGLQRARHDGPRAEERRRRLARADRRHAGAAARDADRRGRREARAGLRHPDRRRLRAARQDAEGRHQGARQHGAGDAGGLHARSRISPFRAARWSARSRMPSRRATPSSSTRRGSRPASWAIRSRPTSSWSASRTSAACCRSASRRSCARSS